MRKNKKRTILHPIMAFAILILITILLSGLLEVLGLTATYNSVDPIRGTLDSNSVMVKSLFNLSGLKTIFSTTISNFASFAPLANLLIILIGIGIMDRSGFLEALFTLLTKKASKFRVTLILSFITVLASVMGDISYIIFIPICALLFKYGHRNPKAGIIMAFAGLTCGTGINVFMSSVDSSMISYTRLAALSLDGTYNIGHFAFFFIMLLLTVIVSVVIALITERFVIPRLGKYEVEDEEEVYLDKKKKRGLLFSLTIGIIYILVFVYNIIPGLPFSGNLLDNSQALYIDKLFGYNSFFNQGFVFIVTLFFFLCGLFYGIGAKTIKDNRDVSEFLGHSLDGIGKTLVLIFFASTFISIFKATNIGTLFAASIGEFITNIHMTGIPLIVIAFVCCILVTLLLPSPVSSWSILSGSLVPVFMNAGLSAEFAQLLFRLSECVTYGLTPIMAYFVIYLAFLDKYSEDGEQLSLTGSIKNMLPYAGVIAGIMIVILILLYVLGIPFGIGGSAIL